MSKTTVPVKTVAYVVKNGKRYWTARGKTSYGTIARAVIFSDFESAQDCREESGDHAVKVSLTIQEVEQKKSRSS